jgi:hypothetical protein
MEIKKVYESVTSVATAIDTGFVDFRFWNTSKSDAPPNRCSVFITSSNNDEPTQVYIEGERNIRVIVECLEVGLEAYLSKSITKELKDGN